MAQTPEGKVKDRAKAHIKTAGGVYDRSAQTGMGQNGRPDDIVWRPGDGAAAGVEYKRDGLFKVSALQRVWLTKLSALGGNTMVINLTNVDSLLPRWLAMPGWRVVARFDDPKKPDLCTGHEVFAPSGESHLIKNPGGKPGK